MAAPVSITNGELIYEAIGFKTRIYFFDDGAMLVVNWTEGFDGEWDFDPVDGCTTYEPEAVGKLRAVLNARTPSTSTQSSGGGGGA